jgi:translation initiation factor 3 subunit D
MAEEQPPFSIPVVNFNPNGWGPKPDNVPVQFKDMPYAPFSKSDRLGKMSDFTLAELGAGIHIHRVPSTATWR